MRLILMACLVTLLTACASEPPPEPVDFWSAWRLIEVAEQACPEIAAGRFAASPAAQDLCDGAEVDAGALAALIQ
jgi:hypothetical protein